MVLGGWIAVDIAIVLALLLISTRARRRALGHEGGVVLHLPPRPPARVPIAGGRVRREM